MALAGLRTCLLSDQDKRLNRGLERLRTGRPFERKFDGNPTQVTNLVRDAGQRPEPLPLAVGFTRFLSEGAERSGLCGDVARRLLMSVSPAVLPEVG